MKGFSFSFVLKQKKQKFKKRSSANAQAGKPPLPFQAYAPVIQFGFVLLN